MRPHPQIVQGGMGVGVSGWRLARAVATAGQLGVVSGTALDVTLARHLWRGDPGGHHRRALGHLPDQRAARRIIDRYHRPAGDGGATFPSVPQHTLRPPRTLTELAVAASFVEVFLAKEGHDGLVGINLLEKIQLPTLPTLYGAMLAGVDYVFMGAGIPARIPAILDQLADHQRVSLPVTVGGVQHADTRAFATTLDPADLVEAGMAPLHRPFFAAIVSSLTLAKYLQGVSSGPPDGFVVEMPSAGGHNAPPRGRLRLSDEGEPVYGARDEVDIDAIAALGRPFWLAGGHARREALAGALDAGATGIQIGTAFAFCDESGIEDGLRRQVLASVSSDRATVLTDPFASPTGYPFKTVPHAGTIADPDVYAARERRCDLGYLREPYLRDDDIVGYRCPSEPVEDYVAKGGDHDATRGRQCLCNGLVATIGLGQTRADGYEEPALLTAGDDLVGLDRFLRPGATSYGAADVIAHVQG